MTTAPQRPAPAMERDSTPWWEALGEHRFVLQRCDQCSRWRWPAREICNECGSFQSTWNEVSGRGTVASWIVNHHAFSPAFSSPYVVLAVRLDEQEDIVMYGSWVGAPDGSDLRLDLPVVVEFEDVAGDEDADPYTSLRWRVAT